MLKDCIQIYIDTSEAWAPAVLHFGSLQLVSRSVKANKDID